VAKFVESAASAGYGAKGFAVVDCLLEAAVQGVDGGACLGAGGGGSDVVG
jgi:hypothetical protein